MAHPAPTQLVPVAAREARSALLAALGTGHIAQQWMIFMETVTLYLPDILSDGRPSKAAISRSVIGLHGFTSWKEMIEADIADGGFGWNHHTWKEWRRAWGVVQEFPWLRHEHLTYSEINAVARKIKAAQKADEQFQPPANMAEATAFIEAEKADRVSKKETAAVIAATEQAAAEAEFKSALAQAQAFQIKRGRTARRIQGLRTRLRQQAKQYSDRESELLRQHGDRVSELSGQLAAARGKVAAYQGMGIRAHLKAAWRCFWTRLKADWQAWRDS